jgi:hypothetical protein
MRDAATPRMPSKVWSSSSSSCSTLRAKSRPDDGQADPTRRPFEQAHAEGLLELVDPPAERRLRDVHRVGGLAEVAQLRDCTEGEQVVQVEVDRHGRSRSVASVMRIVDQSFATMHFTPTGTGSIMSP